jgi:hypothetical protein
MGFVRTLFRTFSETGEVIWDFVRTLPNQVDSADIETVEDLRTESLNFISLR